MISALIQFVVFFVIGYLLTPVILKKDDEAYKIIGGLLTGVFSPLLIFLIGFGLTLAVLAGIFVIGYIVFKALTEGNSD